MNISKMKKREIFKKILFFLDFIVFLFYLSVGLYVITKSSEAKGNVFT